MKKFLVVFIFLFGFINVFAYDKAVIDVTNMNIIEIQDSVSKGLITYEQIVQIYLDRIEAYEDKYNAIITLNENALEEAKKMDLEYKENGRRSLLHGLPILIKDNIDVVGFPTTAGTKALDDNMPKNNSSLVQKLVDAGAIVIAKTNMSEYALYAHNSYSSYGNTYNAYNTKYTPYGSSGGTAVGVAANLAVAGIGTDTGSSVRLPAISNNLIGMRPTFDSVDMTGVIGFDPTRDVAGPITRYVIDNAIMLDIINNNDTNYVEHIDSDLKGIKVGVATQFMSTTTSSSDHATGRTDSDIVKLMNEAIEVLKNNGAEIVYINDLYNYYYYFIGETVCYDFNQYIKNTTGTIRSFSDLIDSGEYVNPLAGYEGYCYTDYRNTSTYKSKISSRNNFISYINNKYKQYDVDVVIYPGLKRKQFKITEANGSNLFSTSYAIAPLAGLPSMTLPIGFINGLPYGMEMMGLSNSEKLIYQIAYKYEQATNYYENPSISPNLYEIPESINKLEEYYLTENKEKEYKQIKEKIANFFKNYSDKDETDINNLIEEYENVPNLIKRNKIIKISIITLAVIVILILLKRKVKHEKIKRINRMRVRSRNNRH